MNATVREILHRPEEFVGKTVSLNGWVRTARDVKACAFVELNDGSVVKNIQLVADAKGEHYRTAAGLNVGTAVRVAGTVVESPNVKQPVEVHVTSLEIEGECPSDYPLQKKRHTVEYPAHHQHLRPRTNLFSAAYRIRSATAFAIHKFFNERGFVYAHTPLITGSDAEGAGAMFQVTTLDMSNPPRTEQGNVDYSQDFFGRETNLTVSGQLEAEVFALAFWQGRTPLAPRSAH